MSRRFAAIAVAMLLAAGACSSDPERAQRTSEDGARSTASPETTGGAAPEGGAGTVAGGRSSGSVAVPSRDPIPSVEPPSAVDGATTGVTDDSITVTYYWKGDRTRSSPLLAGTGQSGLVDEAQAFRAWVDYINDNPKGSIMGYPYDLHGREIRPVIVEAGSSPEANVAAVTDIKASKPFAALAAHGSISAYACPLLAQASIFNLWTYDLDFDLGGRTKGWCMPGGATFDDQVRVMENYLAGRVAASRTSDGEQRVFGFLYAEYPGLVDSAPEVVQRLRARGLKIPVVRSISANLSEAQQEATGIAAAFRAAGVNTMIIPDAGAPIMFTPAAEAVGFQPDYVVWPCSGQDAPAMIRLYTSTQWAGAEGLTCYAQDFMIDLQHGRAQHATEWYQKYPHDEYGEPPGPAPFVYAGLLHLVVGITGAGRALSPKTFQAALDRFEPYRYSAADGRAETSNHMRMAVNGKAHPLVDDFTVLRWDPTANGGTGGPPGTYVFPERGRRYGASHRF